MTGKYEDSRSNYNRKTNEYYFATVKTEEVVSRQQQEIQQLKKQLQPHLEAEKKAKQEKIARDADIKYLKEQIAIHLQQENFNKAVEGHRLHPNSNLYLSILADEMEKLYDKYDFCIFSSEPTVLEKDRFYVDRNMTNGLSYTVINPSGQQVKGNISQEELPALATVKTKADAKRLLPEILNITSTRGHTYEKTGGPLASVKNPDELNEALLALYEILPAEPTEAYARRATETINVLSNLIEQMEELQKAGGDRNDEAIRQLKIRKLTLCIKSRVCIGVEGYLFANELELNKVLLNPDSTGIGLVGDHVGLDETIATLSLRLGEDQLAIRQLQKEKARLQNELQELTHYNDTLSQKDPEVLRKQLLQQQREILALRQQLDDAASKAEKNSEALARQQKTISEQAATIAYQSGILEENGKLLARQEQIILDKENLLRDATSTAEMRGQDVGRLTSALVVSQQENQQLNLQLAETESKIRDQASLIEQQQASIKKLNDTIEAKVNTIQQLEIANEQQASTIMELGKTNKTLNNDFIANALTQALEGIRDYLQNRKNTLGFFARHYDNLKGENRAKLYQHELGNEERTKSNKLLILLALFVSVDGETLKGCVAKAIGYKSAIEARIDLESRIKLICENDSVAISQANNFVGKVADYANNLTRKTSALQLPNDINENVSSSQDKGHSRPAGLVKL